MATIAIPLIASAVSALLPQIPGIVQAVEGWFGGGQGPTKLATALDMTSAAANRLATAGKIDGIPDATTLTTLVETVVQQLKSQGLLDAATPKPAAPVQPSQVPVSPIGSGTGIRIVITGILSFPQ